MSPPLRLFIVAGEPSGDMIAAALVAAMRAMSPWQIEVEGVGGAHLAAQGLRSMFPMEELSVMGLVEVLRHLPRLRRRLAETEAAIRRSGPDVVLSVDSPAFGLRLQRRLRGPPIRRVHYVAPQAWAWRPGRAAALADLVDLLLAVLPFEPAFFARHGVEARFVGHPVVERVPLHGDRRGFVARHGLGDAEPVLLLLPGSRRQEVARHLPIMGQAAALLRQRFARLRTVLPTLPHLAAEIGAEVRSWPLRPVLVTDETERMAAAAAADLAITASGTATLELGLAGVPMIVAHRLHPLTALAARRLVRVPHVALVNLVLGAGVVPELLQGSCRADLLADTATTLLRGSKTAAMQREALANLRSSLVPAGTEAPSAHAARAVLEVAGVLEPQLREAIGTKARWASPV